MTGLHNMKILLGYVLLCGAIVGAARFSWDRYADKPDSWYTSAEGKRIVENILSWQDPRGAWPKNIDIAAAPFTGDAGAIEGTFDNEATTAQMRFLARAYTATQEARYKTAFIKALDLILKAQYPSGGWPQRYPPDGGYQHYITFNDGVMVRLLQLVNDVANDAAFEFVDADRRAAVQKAFDAGIACILTCQIRVGGKRTVWCAQHDEVTYEPRPARSYELVSLSGGESDGILHLLMSLDNPSDAVIAAVTAGARWYESSTVEGLRIEKVNGVRTAVSDPTAPPLWARFYEIETNRPFFCDRDGIPKYDYNQIDPERRNGYVWMNDWGDEVLRDYETWRRRWEHRLLPEGTKILAIVGDSTVCDWPEDDVRRGWGQYIQDYFNDTIRVSNHARSGRSTKTFMQHGLRQQVLDQKPAYVLIQFGHNDSHAPDKPESTDAGTEYAEYLRRYIDEARQNGAIPILVTPMYRRKFDGEGRIHDNLLPYADAMKQVAAEKQVPLVDLNAASEKLYRELGPAGAAELANASDDQTHFNEKGARAMARLVMQQLPPAEPSLKAYLKNSKN